MYGKKLNDNAKQKISEVSKNTKMINKDGIMFV
jgi:hypothetical protein